MTLTHKVVLRTIAGLTVLLAAGLGEASVSAAVVVVLFVFAGICLLLSSQDFAKGKPFSKLPDQS